MYVFTAFPSLNITEMDLVQALLFALAVLLWEVLKWLKLIADSLGCNPHRTKSIKQLMRKLSYEPRLGIERPSKLSEAESKKLNERLTDLFESELFEGPAKAGQSIRLIENLLAIKKLLEDRLEPPATR
jgi:hypothetical protein